MNELENCPHCKVSLIGELIPDDIKEHYAGTYWRREIGIEISELYDGVWYYECPDCKGQWGGRREIKEKLDRISKHDKE